MGLMNHEHKTMRETILSVEERIFYLKKLKDELIANETNIQEALFADLKKPVFEALYLDFYILLYEIDYFLKNIKKLTKKTRVSVPWYLLNTRAYLYPEPYGHVLILGTWNFPFQLTLMPLIGAIAAGNIATVKPSELVKHSESLIGKIISNVFPQEIVNVVTGGVEVATDLLKQRFDLIFFTGSPEKGKSVMRAAAEHLTPVILELGGKNPTIIEDSAKLDQVAADICKLKFLNCGQHCQTVDYVLVNESLKKSLVENITQRILQFYSENHKLSPSFGRIINTQACNRLIGCLNNAKIIYGGEHDIGQCYISPTLVDVEDLDSDLMKQEIFGPILPIISYKNLDDAIGFVNSGEKPLALRFYSDDKEKCCKVIEELSAGATEINDMGQSFLTWDLPFGGIGNSGMGAYHRKASFDAFTHYKPVSETLISLYVPIKYPPFHNNKWLFKILK